MSVFTRIHIPSKLGAGALFLCVAAIAARPTLALADEALAADVSQTSAGASSGALEEITVTARRRSEPLQQVPVAVSVLTGAQASAQNLNNLQDISTAIPSVDFRTGASNKDRDVFIRGIGTITTSPGVEPSVSTVLDGVVLARPGQATAEMLDIDRIEVLRGPQGTLFGKNASAGVINIVTADPTAETHGYAEGSYFGGGDEIRFKGGISGSLTGDNKLLGSISGVYSHYDGNVDNLYNGETLNGYERYGTHAKLIFNATDDLKMTFNGDWMYERDTVPTGVPVSSSQVAYPTGVVTPNANFAAVLAASGVVPSLKNTNVSQNVNSNVRDENGGGSITIDYNFGGYTLTSITGYRKWQNDQDQDYDQISQLTPAFPEIEDHGYLSFYQITEEARIASPKGHFIDYQAGVYYMHAVDTELYHRDTTQLVTGNDVTNSGTSNFGTTADNFSVFGEANFNFTDSFRGILGARAIRDDLSYDFARVSTSPVAVPAIAPSFASAGSTDDWGYADRIGLQYDFSRDVNTYVTYSHGYTGPAYNVFFNMGASATDALKPETSNAYEIGLKSRSLEGRLQANVALFWTDFQNYQANFTDVLNGALVTRLINAGTVSTRGVELDSAWRPIDPLTISFAGAYTHARVVDFNCPPNAAASCNINGQTLPFAPDWKFNLSGEYVIPLSGQLNMLLDTAYRWQSAVQYQLTQTPDTIQGSYGIWDAGIGLADENQGWRVKALVKNITDKSYSSYLAHGDLAGVMRWVPRDNSRYAGIMVTKTF